MVNNERVDGLYFALYDVYQAYTQEHKDMTLEEIDLVFERLKRVNQEFYLKMFFKYMAEEGTMNRDPPKGDMFR